MLDPVLDHDDRIWRVVMSRADMSRTDRVFIRCMVGLLLFMFVMLAFAAYRTDADEGDPHRDPMSHHHRHR
jgi:hypothetical protein